MFSSRTCKHVLPGGGFSDIIYIPVRRGFLYLVAILWPTGLCVGGWATRKVLAWRLSNTLVASCCVEALSEVIEKYGKPRS